MSDTDSTYSMNPRAARPTALGDLRFAGTIAAGLVAGTLGLGALAAPLVGWKDWPSALTQQATSQPVVLAKALPAQARNERTPRTPPPRVRAAAPCSTTSASPAAGAAPPRAPGGLATLSSAPVPVGRRPRAARRAIVRPPAPSADRHDRRRRRRPRTSRGPTAFANQRADSDARRHGYETANTLGKTNAADGQPHGEASGLSQRDRDQDPHRRPAGRTPTATASSTATTTLTATA